MIHEFCEFALFIAMCMFHNENEIEKCSKRFSRAFQKNTIVEQNEYSLYQRRNDDRIWTIKLFENRKFVFDNCWIISYNSYLILRYQTHVNVEICAFVQIVKYIHKYIFKGDAQIILKIDENDKIKRHLNDRYIDPSQIAWKLFEFSMHDEYFSIHHLSLHLLDQQSIYFEKNLTLAKLQKCLNSFIFELLTFFEYNRNNTNDWKILYQN